MCRSLWSVLGVVPRSHLAWFLTEGLLLGPRICQFRDPSVFVSTMLGVQVCAPVPGFLFLLFIYVYFLIHMSAQGFMRIWHGLSWDVFLMVLGLDQDLTPGRQQPFHGQMLHSVYSVWALTVAFYNLCHFNFYCYSVSIIIGLHLLYTTVFLSPGDWSLTQGFSRVVLSRTAEADHSMFCL